MPAYTGTDSDDKLILTFARAAKLYGGAGTDTAVTKKLNVTLAANVENLRIIN